MSRMPRTFVLMTAVLACADAGFASEGGQSHYLLGFNQFQAGWMPEDPGIYFKNSNLFYDGKASAAVRGGNLDRNLRQDSFFEIMSFTVTPGFQLLGGNVGFTVVTPFTHMNMTGDVPALGSVSTTETAGGFADMTLLPTLAWHAGNSHWHLGAAFYLPTGTFETGRLAYTGLGYWTIEPCAGYTFLDLASGLEISAFAGFGFNTLNPATQYQSGMMFHLDWVAAMHFSDGLAFGVGGYYFDQVTDDRGAGTQLGGFQGQAVALGPSLQYAIAIGAARIALDLKYLREFDVMNRFAGNALWFQVSLKL